MTLGPRSVAFAGSRIVLRLVDDRLRLPALQELAEALGTDRLEGTEISIELRDLHGEQVRAFVFDEDDLRLPSGFRIDRLRVAWNGLGPDEFRLAGTARQKIEWHRTHRYCSRCGTPTRRADDHEAMACPACGQLHFPRIAPAVIVLVERGSEVLLARSPHFNPGVYSTIAGFVEPGESLEECVHREIEEEVGVRVHGLRYFGSQPHPFPHSLMIGFTAKWLEGDVRIDPAEIEDAQWFALDALPDLPHPRSIARALIEDWMARRA